MMYYDNVFQKHADLLALIVWCDDRAEKRELGLIDVTFFPNQSAQTMRVESLTLPHLCDHIQETNRAAKSNLPWLKCATFGDERSDKNSLRNNDNVISITGVELDYDDKKMSLDEAIAIAEKAGLKALFYTTGSHTPEAPKWRIVLPTSRSLPPERRYQLV